MNYVSSKFVYYNNYLTWNPAAPPFPPLAALFPELFPALLKAFLGAAAFFLLKFTFGLAALRLTCPLVKLLEVDEVNASTEDAAA